MEVNHKSPFMDRLFSRIGVSESGCWLYAGSHNACGYATISLDKASRLVHRIVWEMTNGPVPERLELDHLCQVRGCCNPDHLEPVTHAENMRRSAPAQKSYCVKGHEFTPENTARRADRYKNRVCRTCARDSRNASRARRKLAIDQGVHK